MSKGKFIVLEGICGAGKSTAAEQLEKLMNNRGLKTVYNHGACTYTDTGQSFKAMVRAYPDLFATSYYVADLVQNTVRQIIPWLEAGYTVIQDRYVDSITSYIRAFHGGEQISLDIKPVIDLYTEMGLLINPDLNILCHAPSDVILSRLESSDASEIQRRTYSANPLMIEIVQRELMKLADERSSKEAVIHLNTKFPIDWELVLEKAVRLEPTSSTR